MDEINLGTQSSFNEASLKMIRIHKFQETSGVCNFNPLQPNQQTGTYNYEVIFECNNNLLKECWGKMNDKEREELKNTKDYLQKFLKKHPIHKQINFPNENKPQTKTFIYHWEIYKEALFNYELRIRELLTRIKYDSPDMDEGGLFD
jgi:hypothetical protein